MNRGGIYMTDAGEVRVSPQEVAVLKLSDRARRNHYKPEKYALLLEREAAIIAACKRVAKFKALNK